MSGIPRAIVLLALLASACPAEPEAESAFGRARRLLIQTVAETGDTEYRDPRFDAVIAAFEQVPLGASDRDQAAAWVARLRAGRSRGGASRPAPALAARDWDAEVARLAGPAPTAGDPPDAVPAEAPAPYPAPENAPSKSAAELLDEAAQAAQAQAEAEREAAERAARQAALYADNTGRTEEDWRAEKARLDRRLAAARDAVERAEKEWERVCAPKDPLRAEVELLPMPHASASDLSHHPSRIDIVDSKRQGQGEPCEQVEDALDEARDEVTRTRKALAGLKERARKAGAEPGWVR